MQLHAILILAILIISAGAPSEAASDPSQPDVVELAMMIEVKPGSPQQALQPPTGTDTTGSLNLSPSGAMGLPATDTANPASSAGASSFMSGQDPSDTASTSATEPVAPPSTKLVVVGWQGAYGQALRRAVLDPFRDSAEVEIEYVAATSGSSVPEAGVDWDVADVPSVVARQACETGAIAQLGTVRLTPGAYGAHAQEDFLAGSLDRCAVGSFAWSSLVLVDPRAFRRGLPETLADVFDAKRFRQKRAFARSPRYLLEMALLADGVAPGRVYGELATREGQMRAFKKLDGIRKYIVWSDKPETAMKLLGKSEVGMATAFSGRAFYALASELRPYRIIWDGQIYDLSVWVVSSKSQSKAAALDFVAFATRPDRLAAVSRWFPYGPVRLSAVDLVGRHPTLGMDLQPFLPTAPANMANALRFNERFWQHYEAPLQQSLEAWIKGEKPLPDVAAPTGAARAH
jgi:putative spermidine/putrescine transport system substrate-binding protein